MPSARGDLVPHQATLTLIVVSALLTSQGRGVASRRSRQAV